MADLADSNNPAGSPPEPAADISSEIMDTLGLSDTSGAAAAIAAKAADSSGDATPPTPAGDSSPALVPAGDTPPPEAPPAPSQPAAPEPAPASAPGATPPPASPAPVTPPAAPTPPVAVDEAVLREASLKAQVDALSRTVEQLRANPQGTPSGTPPPAESGTTGEQPVRYNLTLPQQVQADLMSEDPAKNMAAISAIVNDLGTIVHNAVRAELRKEIQVAVSSISSSGEQGEREQATAKARDAYYAAFPTHNSPLALPIVQAEAQKLSAEFPGLPWDANYINALGARVNKAIADVAAATGGVVPPPAPPAVPAAVPPARPAPMMPSGNRAADAVSSTGDLSEEILGVLDPFA